MIVADTSAIIALIDADSAEHDALRAWYDADPGQWLLPWAILPAWREQATRVSAQAEQAFLQDFAEAQLAVEWGGVADVVRARELCARYASLKLGLVDAVVMAVAERLRAEAIATLDLRHFGAVKLKTAPLLLPRDG